MVNTNIVHFDGSLNNTYFQVYNVYAYILCKPISIPSMVSES